MPYTMKIYTKKSAVGHFAIEFDNGNGDKVIAGFGPDDGFKGVTSIVRSAKGKMDLQGNSNGTKDSEEQAFNPDDFIASRSVVLTEAQYRQALRYRDEYARLVEEGKITYEANDNNCIRFAGSVLNAIGSKETLSDILSDEQKDLVNLANLSIDPERTLESAKRKGADAADRIAKQVGEAARTGEQVVLARDAAPSCAAETLADATLSMYRGESVDLTEQIKNIGDCAMQRAEAIQGAKNAAVRDGANWTYEQGKAAKEYAGDKITKGMDWLSEQGTVAKEYVTEQREALSAWGMEKAADVRDTVQGLFSDDTKENDAISDPRVESMLELMNSPVSNPGLAALLKPVENLTESEMRDLINSAQTDYRGWKSGDPLKAHTYEKAQDWHVAMYGDGPQQYDGGKAIVPAPIRPIPEQSTSPVTPDGNDLGQAVAGLGRTIAAAAQNDGFERMVQGLQQGLNLLNQHNPLPPRSPAYGPYTKLDPVKVDGVYGPRTDFALKQATARLGANKVEDALALGRFNDFARNAQKNRNPDGLENATRAAFAGLFRDPKDARAPKVENGVLQDTLNALGSRARNDWQPLKVDDWIGPKTTAAFGQVLEKDDADSLTTAFGRGLGLL